MVHRILKYLNLALMVCYPIAWFAPLISAGLLPIFGLDKISIISGIRSIWDTDPVLASVVIAFAMFAPVLKTSTQVLKDFYDFALLPDWVTRALARFAMADVFLIALYITVIKGIGVGRVQTEWGLYFFSLCVIISIIISLSNPRTSP
jgi:paraquat-inducible protein A